MSQFYVNMKIISSTLFIVFCTTTMEETMSRFLLVKVQKIPKAGKFSVILCTKSLKLLVVYHEAYFDVIYLQFLFTIMFQSKGSNIVTKVWSPMVLLVKKIISLNLSLRLEWVSFYTTSKIVQGKQIFLFIQNNLTKYMIYF